MIEKSVEEIKNNNINIKSTEDININNHNENTKLINENTNLIKDKKIIDVYLKIDESQKSEINKIKKNIYSSRILSLSEGLSTFSDLALSYYFKDNLKLNPSKSNLFQSILNLPYVFQPLFGLISDFYTFLGYKRKSHIILNGFIIFICWLILIFFNPSINLTIIILLIKNISLTFLYGCTNAVLIEISKNRTDNDKKLDRFNESYIYINLGTIISSIIRGYILEYYHVKISFLISSILSCLNIVGGILYYEVKITNQYLDENKNINIHKFFNIITQKKIFFLLIYVLIITCIPSYYESSFYYLTDIKDFSKKNFGYLTFISMISYLISSIINQKYLKAKNPKKVIISITILSFLLGLSYNIWIFFNIKSKLLIFISLPLYQASKSLSVKVIINLGFLEIPKGYEGSIMGLFSSTRDFGDTLSYLFGAFFTFLFDIEKTKYKNFNIMIFIINLLSLSPILFTKYLNNE